MKKATRSLLQGLLLTCLSASVLAASMDASNQEGINAGKSADGTTSADPNGYFDNYSSDAPQRGYYSGPTQTSSNIDVKGQTELTESDLGQTAHESYVNNPADKLSHDSDMMKRSDEIRNSATDAANLVDGSIEKTAMTIRTILTTYVRSLRYLQGLDEDGKRPFNIRDWLHTEDASGDNPWIFISSDGQNHNALKPLLSAWLYMTMSGILGLRADRNRRIWIYLDEAPTLHKLPILPEFCAEGRKFGACTVLGLQNFPQMEETYGTSTAKSIWDLLNTRIFYRAPSGAIAEWVQKEIGEKRHKKFKDQYSYGVDIIRDGVQFSKDEVNEYLVSYSDVQSLNDLECYVTLPGDWPVVRMKLPWKPYRAIAEGRIPRNVEDVFDPEIEATLAGEIADNQAGQIVGRLFGDATEAAAPAKEQRAGNTGTAAGTQSSAAPAENATASSSVAQAAPAEAGGRVVALTPPVAESSASLAPAAQQEAEQRIQVMDVVKHNSADFGLDRY